jgi:RimJ/RimL family protein N-acetyltransferase
MNMEKRVLIRPFQQSDFDDFQCLILDKMSGPYKDYDDQFLTDVTSLRNILSYFSTSDEFFVVEHRKEKKVIGFVSLNKMDKPNTYNVGYVIHSLFQHQGYGKEAVSELFVFAQKEKKATTLESFTAKINTPSIRLLLSLGFQPLETTKASFVQDEFGNPKTFEAVHFICNLK